MHSHFLILQPQPPFLPHLCFDQTLAFPSLTKRGGCGTLTFFLLYYLVWLHMMVTSVPWEHSPDAHWMSCLSNGFM